MIAGDIDLTENLDFRKTVRRELPAIPASWNGGNRINKSKTHFTLSSAVNELENYNRTHSSTTVTYQYSDWESSTNVFSTTTGSFTISNNTYYIRYDMDRYSNNKITNVLYDYKIPEPNCFDEYIGNEIISNESRIPWKVDEIAEVEFRIPWISESKNNRYRIQRDIPKLPYGWEDEESEYISPSLLLDKYKRAKLLISWLMKKSTKFIIQYLNHEEDKSDLDYLTNMNWIHVRDAIID